MSRNAPQILSPIPDFPRLSAGVDEVGRGPLAGPVVAAAVILDPQNMIEGLCDSKALGEAQRERLAARIHQQALAVSIAEASVDEIDGINILQASMLAMQRAVARLQPSAELCLIDGNRTPFLPVPALAFVKGDQRVPAISAASIVAKVYRDAQMIELGRQFPVYGFEKHKGYPTKAHLQALASHGPLSVHRRTFGPVQKILADGETTAGWGAMRQKSNVTQGL